MPPLISALEPNPGAVDRDHLGVKAMLLVKFTFLGNEDNDVGNADRRHTDTDFFQRLLF